MFGAMIMMLAHAHTALAVPPPAALARLDRSYQPEATASVSPAGRSLSFCPLTDLRLTVKDPVTGDEGFVQARIYDARRESEREQGRTVILLPPTGGENVLDQGYANSLCSAGFRTVLLQTWYRQTEAKLDMGMHDEGAQRSQAAIKHVLDWLKPSRATQVGILGTSVGALSSALATGYEARIASAVLIVGGVDMAGIIGESDEKGAAALREARMRELGLRTRDDYVNALRAHVTIEPADFAGYTGQKPVLAFVGTTDTTVPTANQRELVRVFGAEVEEFAGDHVKTILNTFTWKRGKIVSFFERTLR